MPSRFITWLFATIFALLTGTHALAGDGLRMVTATGRAVINDQAAQHEAKILRLKMRYILQHCEVVPRSTGFLPYKPIPVLMIISLCARQVKFLIIAL